MSAIERRWTDGEIGDMREEIMNLRGVPASLTALNVRLDTQDHLLGQIHAQTLKTNGRVTAHDVTLAVYADRERQANTALVKQDRRNQLRFTIGAAVLGMTSSVVGYLFLIAIGVHP
jgi:hypothetical protein